MFAVVRQPGIKQDELLKQRLDISRCLGGQELARALRAFGLDAYVPTDQGLGLKATSRANAANCEIQMELDAGISTLEGLVARRLVMGRLQQATELREHVSGIELRIDHPVVRLHGLGVLLLVVVYARPCRVQFGDYCR